MNDATIPSAEPDAGNETSRLPFPVVGIGASAGCVDALLRLFERMPPDPGMAFVVIVHLSPEHESMMDRILAKATQMPVLQVREAVAIEANHVYVISPTLQLAMDDGHLRVTELERPHGGQIAIDTFFRTLAQSQRERAVCIVMSGTGSDGSLGSRRVKEYGGVTLAQAPDDAEYDDMPHSAIASGAIDLVLRASEMGGELVALWANMQRIELPDPEAASVQASAAPTPEAAERAGHAFDAVMLQLRSRTGHDFKHYKRATVLRRLERRLQVNGVSTLPEYNEFLQTHPEESQALLKDMLISVTNFFRDAEAFDALGHELDASLFDNNAGEAGLRAWVAGCATGEEAYSIAMLLSEKVAERQRKTAFQVFASDIDESAIAVARAGLYPESIVADVAPSRLRTFFEKDQHQVRVRRSLRERVLFAAHNVLRDPPFSNLDLLCCRNLLIYLDREAQVEVLRVFHFALRPGGLLFLGLSESADAIGELFSPVDRKHRIYRANAARRSRRSLPGFDQRTMLFRTPPEAPPPAEPRDALDKLHERLQRAHLPPSVLIDATYLVLHSTAGVDTFLRFAPGHPSQNLLEVVLPELRVELRAALFTAWREQKSVDARRVRLELGGRSAWIMMSLRPAQHAGMNLMLVGFDEAAVVLDPLPEEGASRDPMLVLIEEELQRTREQLQGTLGDSAASNEELRASNEELQAINEELRSATEELETSKEELQSVNEELITVNHELKVKVDETGKANDDLKNLIASTDIATVFVDRHLRIKRYTPRASYLFNLIPSDVGRSLLDITHRLDYPQLEQDTVQAFEALRLTEREVVGEGARNYLVRVLPYRTHLDVIDGAVLSFIDISSARQAEERLRVGEANLRMVVESTQDYAIVTLDTDGKVTAWNPGARRIFGYEEGEVLGQPIDILFTPEDRAAGIPQSEQLRARDDGRASDERWHLRRDGTTFYCSGVMTPIHERGALIGYAKIARDLTAAKRAELQLEAMFAQERETRAQLQRAIALKDEFLAVMSHELKQPLNLIHVNAELLSRLPEVRDSPPLARAAGVIRRTVMSQAKIIDDLLDLARLRTGKLTLVSLPVAWDAVVSRTLEAMAADIATMQLRIRTDIEEDLPAVQADPVRVEQIVWNLLSNAIKFTPASGEVTVRLATDGAFCRLDVNDTGQGIAREFLAHVFDMFRQADRGTTRLHGGLGIGLALVKQLAEEHGGRVAVASEGAGRGAAFSVWLPIAHQRAPGAAQAHNRRFLEGLCVLAVDDAEDALESFAMLLTLEGAEVVAVPNGDEALRAVEAHRFDLILSDVAMPGMDGYELIAALRRDPRTADVPAVALTGFGRPQDVARAREAGFDAHVTKPIVVDDLMQILRSLPARRQRAGGEAP